MTGAEALSDPAVAIPLVAILLVSGAAIGILAGLFGVGGGAISVPVFYEAFQLLGSEPDIAMPVAVGTSLAMIVPTSIRSVRAHAAKGTVDFALLRSWAAPILVGVALGSFLARHANASLFQSVFVFVAGVNAVKLLFTSGAWKLRDEMPGIVGTSLYGFITGILAALMGIGAGAISNMILTLHGRPIHEAVSTSAGVGVLIAIPGTVGYILAGWGKPGLPLDAIGYVSILALAFTVPTALLTARIGVSIAHGLSRDMLGRLFGVFLILVCIRFLIALT